MILNIRGVLFFSSTYKQLGIHHSILKTSKKLNRLKKSITLLGQIGEWTRQDKSLLPRRERLTGECREMWLSGAETCEQKLPWEPVLGLESWNYNWQIAVPTTLSIINSRGGASLVAQWLRICLPMQGTRLRALVWEDPTCRGATGPMSHNYWACASGACAPQQGRPQWWEACAPRWRVDPARHNWRKPSHRNEDPTQPKINIINK